jgi:hypothetical protein
MPENEQLLAKREFLALSAIGYRLFIRASGENERIDVRPRSMSDK